MIKIIQSQKTSLSYAIDGSATTFKLKKLLKLDGTPMSASDIGDSLNGTIDPGVFGKEEIININGSNVTVNSDNSVEITGVLRGRKEVSPYGAGGYATDHGAGAVVVFGNNPQLYDSLAFKANANTFTQQNIFSGYAPQTDTDPVAGNDLTRLSYVQALVLGTLTTIDVVVPGTAGETIADGNSIYLNTDNKWYKTDADTASTVNNVLLGIAKGAGTLNNAITNGILLQGTDNAQSGLVAGEVQYASNTAGAISNTPGTNEVTVGIAKSATELYFAPRFNQQLTEAQQDALDNATGGALTGANPVVSNDDTSATPSGSKIIRWSGGAYPAGNGANITGIDLKAESYTASGSIAQNDSVYVSSANTVKTVYPSAQGTGSAISTAPSHILTTKSLPLSTSGMYLNISGGYRDISDILYAQVRTINAGETDFSNGSEATVYNTGNGTRWYDVCLIDTDKFLFLFQSDTGGVDVGIKAVVATVSGTTVTVGTPVTIEAVGSLTAGLACSKVDTDKGIIFYKDDAGNDIYMKVLSVSGTTITQNSAVLLKTTSNIQSISSVQLATNSVAVTYSPGSTSLFGSIITISGTTPSAGAEQTIIGASETYYHKITFISATKLLLTYEEDGANATYASTIAISGATMTASSTLSLEASVGQMTWGTSVIGTKYALVMARDTDTNNKLYFLDISSTTPTTISTQNLSQTSDSGNYVTTCIVKVSPWTYMATGPINDGDYIVKMTPVSSARIGVAESAILDTVAGNILIRYKTQTLSGITLTAGSIYYVDDSGQPTTKSSLTSPTLGVAISTTKILLQ